MIFNPSSNKQQGFLPLSGGTMEGPITLSGDPTQDLQAATKQYTDKAAKKYQPSTFQLLVTGRLI